MTAALLGTSGSGKSSLINALVGTDVVRTGAVRQADAKGRHTTTWRELVVRPDGGILIDTPGLRELGMWIAGEGIGSCVSRHFRSTEPSAGSATVRTRASRKLRNQGRHRHGPDRSSTPGELSRPS